MKKIAKNAGKIYFFAVLFMLVKSFLPLEPKIQNALSLLTLLMVLIVVMIEKRVNKKS